MKTKRIVALALGACLAVASRAGADATGVASYVVPAAHGAPEVSYPVPNFSLTQDAAGSRTLVFSLPEDLVGDEVAPVALYENAPGTSRFTGAGVAAECAPAHPARDATTCRIAYAPEYLHADRGRIRELLDRKYARTPEVIPGKRAASERFLSDPEGILRFTSSPAA
jgi:hypothetical protein